MKVSIAIVDDNKFHQEQLINLLNNYSWPHSWETDVAVFNSAETFLRELHPGRFQIIFLDIVMTNINGMEAARQLRQIDPTVVLIFITIEQGYAIDGYEFDAAAYLIKPIQQNKFEHTMQRLERRFQAESILQIPGYNTVYPVLTDSLLYVEIQNRLLKVHTDTRVLISSMTLEEFKGILPDISRFFECYRGILIHLDRVQQIGRQFVTLDDGSSLPISRRRRANLEQSYALRCIAKTRNSMLM